MSSEETAGGRVLAVTRDAALDVAFSLMAGDWKVDAVKTGDEALRMSPLDYSAVVVDLKTTTRGLEEAAFLLAQFPKLKCLVVGDIEADEASLPVLLRPFSVDQLRIAVARIAADHATYPRPQPAPAQAPLQEAPATPKEEPPPIKEEPPPIKEEPPPIKEEPPPIKEEPPPIKEEPPPIKEEPPPIKEEPPPIPREAPAKVLTEFDPAKAVGWVRQHLRRKEREPEEEASEIYSELSITLADRLAMALRSLREVESLVTEVPALASTEGMGLVIAEEIASRFPAETVAIYVRNSEDSMTVRGQVGLSSAEVRMDVKNDHPLVAKILSTGKPVYIENIDSVLGFVAGLAGARFKRLVVCPLAEEDKIHGLAVVSGRELSKDDTDKLDRLAREAAPGLALARKLEFLPLDY